MNQPEREPAQIETKVVQLLASDLPKLVVGGQLSRRASFSLRVDGPFERTERKALMQLLEAQMNVLDEDEQT